MVDNKEIGRRLQELRKARGYTYQEDLATVMSVKSETISRWETGVRTISTTDILRLAKFLHVKPSYFLDEEPPVEEWPPELKEAIECVKELPPDIQSYIYRLWLAQAGPHVQVYRDRDAVAKELLLLREERSKYRADEKSDETL